MFVVVVCCLCCCLLFVGCLSLFVVYVLVCCWLVAFLLFDVYWLLACLSLLAVR